MEETCEEFGAAGVIKLFGSYQAGSLSRYLVSKLLMYN